MVPFLFLFFFFCWLLFLGIHTCRSKPPSSRSAFFLSFSVSHRQTPTSYIHTSHPYDISDFPIVFFFEKTKKKGLSHPLPQLAIIFFLLSESVSLPFTSLHFPFPSLSFYQFLNLISSSISISSISISSFLLPSSFLLQ